VNISLRLPFVEKEKQKRRMMPMRFEEIETLYSKESLFQKTTRFLRWGLWAI
jgi:hypothetical protein